MFQFAAYLLAATVAIFAGICPAAAEPGHLVAEVSGPVPPRSRISIQPSETGARADTLVQVIAQSLERQGFQASMEGGLILEFRIDDSRVAELGRDSKRDFRQQNESSDEKPDGDLNPLKLNLERTGRQKLGNELKIEFYLFKKGRPPVWSATIEATPSEPDEDKQFVRMTEAAMDTFGRNEDRFFDLLE